jgi:hypothetical protein
MLVTMKDVEKTFRLLGRLQRQAVIRQVTQDYNLVVHDVAVEPEWIEANGRDAYQNCSASAGHEIWIGLYDDDDLRCASFLHEVGHTLEHARHPRTRYTIERAAWKIGLHLGKLYGLDLNKPAVRVFAREGILSHCDSERRDHLCCAQDTLHGRKLWWHVWKTNARYKLIQFLTWLEFHPKWRVWR